ncbi:hypothetical protein AYJ57_21350 (plasmid) [Salipiger sp. CCB-MM3]|nr:hypothetical protein AYJ57_21350 [Salipiger sp. CCB-MM3]
MGGGSKAGKALAQSLSDTLGLQHTLLFPTGWAAGYGAIRGIVRSHDYIVMDALAHNCLQHGAQASTQNVSVFIHNSPESLAKRLERIRRKAPDAAILVVFESLYSMDSDCPPIEELVRVSRQYDAHTMVDIAHDFGILGKDGRGLLADQGGYGSVDLIIGSFSKVFGAIGGFVASGDLNLIRAIQGFSGSYTFSNFLTPPQIAAAHAALEIAFSEEGRKLRNDALRSCKYLRALLDAQGLQTFGIDSGMVIVKVGQEARAREAYKRILDDGVIVNCIEFPAVRRGEARFRIQLTPEHTADDLLYSAGVIAEALTYVGLVQETKRSA